MENIDQSPDLIEVLGQITPLPEPFQQRVNSQLQTETYSARTLLLRPGETYRKRYFIKSEFFRAYHIYHLVHGPSRPIDLGAARSLI